ncbi:MAG TPA: tetratricopeptide repeat protein [Actinomycetota bacterium]
MPRGGARDEISALNRQVADLYRQGSYAEALELGAQVVERSRRALREGHPDFATSLNNLAEVHRALGSYAEAEPLYRQSLEIRRACFPGGHEDVAISLHNFGMLKKALGDPQGARSLHEEAVQVWRGVLGDRHPLVAFGLDALAELESDRGDLANAERLYREGLEIRRAALPDGHPEIAHSLNNLGGLFATKGDYVAAEPLLAETIEIFEGAYGREHPGVALALHNLAGVNKSLGNYGESEPQFREALAIRRRILGEDHPDVAATLYTLGWLEFDRGNYAGAEPLFRDALRIWTNGLGERHPMVAYALGGLGDLHHAIGDLETSERLLMQALSIRRAVLGEEAPETLSTLASLGNLHRQMGNAEGAVNLLRHVLEAERGRVGRRSPDSALTLNNLGGAEQALGSYDDAERHYAEALETLRESFGNDHPLVGVGLNNLAGVHQDRGRHEDAKPLLRDALQGFRRGLGEHHPNVEAALNNLAWASAATRDPREALAYYREALAVTDHLLAQVFSIGSELQRAAFADLVRGGMEALLSLVLTQMPEDPEAVGFAADVVLRRKAIGAEALAAQRDAVLGGRHPDLAPKLRELAMLRMQIATKTLAGPGPEGPDEHRRLLDRWAEEKETLERLLAHSIPEMSMERKLQVADRQAVGGALPEGSVLVEFVRFIVHDFHAVRENDEPRWGPPRYVAFVLPAGDPEAVALVDLGEAEPIDELIAALRGAITGEGESRGMGDGRKPRKSAELEVGAALRKAVFDPLQAALGGSSRLFLALDGDLTRLPFEVLPTEGGGRLIGDFQLSYLSTGRDLVRFGVASEAETTGPVVAADPDFDLGGSAAPAAPTGRRSRDLDPTRIHFDRLQGTAGEGKGVADLLGATPWLSGEVLEARLKAAVSPRILHLATHGFFLADQPRDPEREAAPLEVRDASDSLGPLRGPGLENPLLRSGLALAGANTFLTSGTLPPDAEDGILTAEDVSGLDLLGTELVVLSACETGLGEVRVGEGVFGLRRAFVLAGARTLVMSLWKVPDVQTRELMEDFYARLKAGEPRAEALRQAQLDLARTYPHPWFWGAFICQGDPGPLAPHGTTAAATTSRPRRAEPSEPPPVPEPPEPPAPEPLAVPGSLAEVVGSVGVPFADFGGGALAVPLKGQRLDEIVVNARELPSGLALFSVPLPELPRRKGRKDVLRHLLRVSYEANYAKAVLLESGQVFLAAEMPMSVLTPEVAAGLLAGLAALGDGQQADLPSEERWQQRVSLCLANQSAHIRVDEAALRSIASSFAEAGAGVGQQPDGTIVGALGLRGPGPDVVVSPTEVVISVLRHVGPLPPGDEKASLARLLELNRIADVAKVGLDGAGEVVVLYEVPTLTPDLVRQAAGQMAMLMTMLATGAPLG